MDSLSEIANAVASLSGTTDLSAYMDNFDLGDMMDQSAEVAVDGVSAPVEGASVDSAMDVDAESDDEKDEEPSTSRDEPEAESEVESEADDDQDEVDDAIPAAVPPAIPLSTTIRGFGADLGLGKNLTPADLAGDGLSKYAATLFSKTLPTLATVVEQKGAIDPGSSVAKSIVTLLSSELGNALGIFSRLPTREQNRMAAVMILMKVLGRTALPPLTKTDEGVLGAINLVFSGAKRKVLVSTHSDITKFIIFNDNGDIPTLGVDTVAPLMKYYDPRLKLTTLVLIKNLGNNGTVEVKRRSKGKTLVMRERVPVECYLFRAFPVTGSSDAIYATLDFVKRLLKGVSTQSSYVYVKNTESIGDDFLNTKNMSLTLGDAPLTVKLSFRKPTNATSQSGFKRWLLICKWLARGGRIELGPKSTLRSGHEEESLEEEVNAGCIRSMASLTRLASRAWSPKNVLKVNDRPVMTPSILNEIPDFVHKGNTLSIWLLFAASLRLDVTAVKEWLSTDGGDPRSIDVAKLTYHQYLFLRLLSDAGIAKKGLSKLLTVTNNWLITEMSFIVMYKGSYDVNPTVLSTISDNSVPNLHIFSWIGDVPLWSTSGIIEKVKIVHTNSSLVSRMMLLSDVTEVAKVHAIKAKVRAEQKASKESTKAEGAAKKAPKRKREAEAGTETPKKKQKEEKSEKPKKTGKAEKSTGTAKVTKKEKTEKKTPQTKSTDKKKVKGVSAEAGTAVTLDEANGKKKSTQVKKKESVGQQVTEKKKETSAKRKTGGQPSAHRPPSKKEYPSREFVSSDESSDEEVISKPRVTATENTRSPKKATLPSNMDDDGDDGFMTCAGHFDIGGESGFLTSTAGRNRKSNKQSKTLLLS
ncbi:ORF1R [Ictalurid herpesvirus 1]|nr:ORF1L [Ictalurid herpesvirus 1]QAB08562.1 ORF1R [Ictalurid herpesvirus 1]